jgi:hypothetical protein
MLDLKRNNLGDDGAIALAPALREMSELEELNLGKNEFGEEGRIALAPVERVMVERGGHVLM